MLHRIPTATLLAHPAWLESGPDCDVVISSRIRIARNLRDYPFPHLLTARQQEETEGLIAATLPGLNPVQLGDLRSQDRDALAASRLAPVRFAGRPTGLFLVDDPLAISVLINEEDHIRIQAFQPGSLLLPAVEMAKRVERDLLQKLPLAWNTSYGYLTASPANAGSGVRASSLLHLPALGSQKRLPRWLKAAQEAGVTMRGVYGEGSRAVGAFFQLSVMPGREETEEQAAGRLLAVIRLLAREERQARGALGSDWIDRKAAECNSFVRRADRITLGQGLRILSWVRLAAATVSLEAARHVDAWSGELLVNGRFGRTDADEKRAETLQRCFEGPKVPTIV